MDRRNRRVDHSDIDIGVSYPDERYGTATAVLFGVVLMFGTLLYYLRGVLMSRPRAGNSPIPGDEGRNGDSPGR